MKKIFAVVAALCLLASSAACSVKEDSPSESAALEEGQSQLVSDGGSGVGNEPDADGDSPPKEEPDMGRPNIFALGRGGGGAQVLENGDSIGGWTVDDIQYSLSGDGELEWMSATFLGNVSLSGSLVYDDILGSMFTVASGDEGKMPVWAAPMSLDYDAVEFVVYFTDAAWEEIGEQVEGADAPLACEITLDSYSFASIVPEGVNSASVESIIILD